MKKMREMREKKDIVLIYIILFCKYIILMSRRGKYKFGMWRYCKIRCYNDKVSF